MSLADQVKGKQQWRLLPLADALRHAEQMTTWLDTIPALWDRSEDARGQIAERLRKTWDQMRGEMDRAVEALARELEGARPKRPITPAVRSEIVHQAGLGVPIAELARRFGASRPTIRDVLKKTTAKHKKAEKARLEKNRPRLIEEEDARRLAEEDPTLHQVLLNESGDEVDC